jgi:hypothetical protein
MNVLSATELAKMVKSKMKKQDIQFKSFIEPNAE